MAEFARPLPRKANIPAPVPVEQLDDARKKEYGELIKANNDLEKPIDEGALPTVSPGLPVAAKEEKPKWFPTEEDKKVFLRSVLGGHNFSKTYVLFGSINAYFEDRSVELTETMYEKLDEDIKAGRIKVSEGDDDTWETWAERYVLACTLRLVKDTSAGAPSKGEAFEAPTDFFERYRALIKRPRPVYQALMEAARCFEALLKVLIDAAQESDFWKSGGHV